MLPLRLAKIACVAALALYAGVVAFGNVADYWTNFAFVTHVLDMDQLPKESSIRWRAITSVTLHHAIYLLIIGTEIVIAALAVKGAISMARRCKASALSFQKAKSSAVVALTLVSLANLASCSGHKVQGLAREASSLSDSMHVA